MRLRKISTGVFQSIRPIRTHKVLALYGMCSQLMPGRIRGWVIVRLWTLVSLKLPLHKRTWHRADVVRFPVYQIVVAALLIYTSEEQCFYLLSILCDQILPSYYTPTMAGTILDQKVFEHLVEKTLPLLSQYFKSKDIQLSLASLPWFLSLYLASMPLVFAFRIVDCVLLFGPRVGLNHPGNFWPTRWLILLLPPYQVLFQIGWALKWQPISGRGSSISHIDAWLPTLPFNLVGFYSRFSAWVSPFESYWWSSKAQFEPSLLWFHSYSDLEDQRAQVAHNYRWRRPDQVWFTYPLNVSVPGKVWLTISFTQQHYPSLLQYTRRFSISECAIKLQRTCHHPFSNLTGHCFPRIW